jgi:dipeptide transport system ATP-binding protein
MTSTPVLETRGITRDYSSGGLFGHARTTRALKGIDLRVDRGQTLAVVGESGCGKSTLARIITMIDAPSGGALMIEGENVDIARNGVSQELRRKVQIVFQNPYGSLNPRQKIGDVLAEPLKLNTSLPAGERRDRAMEMLLKVGLKREHFNRYPHMFSGGQRQRIAIARAIMVHPVLLVLDEPVSALDLSVQAQILNLLQDLQDEFQLTYVFISHDLSVVRHVDNDVMVVFLGEAVEERGRDDSVAAREHSYTLSLVAATPQFDIARRRNRGRP